jgi:hypothetical protein
MAVLRPLRCVAIVVIAAGAWIAIEGSAVPGTLGADAVEPFDQDGDGSIDLKEAKAAAAALFDILDVDNDRTLTNKELGGRAEVMRGLMPSPNP